MKKIGMIALWVAVTAWISMADTVLVVHATEDVEWRDDGQNIWASQTSAYVGTQGGTRASYVLSFRLPPLIDASEVIDRVELDFTIEQNGFWEKTSVYLNILGGRTSDSSATRASDWDKGQVIAEKIENLGLPGPELGRHSYLLDKTFFEGIYAENNAGTYVFLTLYADALFPIGDRIITVATNEGTVENRPALKITTVQRVIEPEFLAVIPDPVATEEGSFVPVPLFAIAIGLGSLVGLLVMGFFYFRKTS